MQPTIGIDISDVVNEALMSEGEVKSFARFILDRVSKSYMDIWEDNVGKELHQTKRPYLEAMSAEYVDDFNIMFKLSGKGKSAIAMMMEQGAAPFDIKEGMKNSPKAKNAGQDDWYITIPFRVATPEAVAESEGFSSQMDDIIYDIVKKEGEITTKNLPEGYGPDTRKALMVKGEMRVEYKHKTNKFVGLKKYTDDSGRGTYKSFRRISENSDKDSWLHKGMEAKHLMEKSLNELSNEIEYIVGHAKKDFFNKR